MREYRLEFLPFQSHYFLCLFSFKMSYLMQARGLGRCDDRLWESTFVKVVLPVFSARHDELSFLGFNHGSRWISKTSIL